MDYKQKKALKAKIKHENNIKKVGKCDYVLDTTNPYDRICGYDLEHDLMDMYSDIKRKVLR